MSHDPLCPSVKTLDAPNGPWRICACYLIAHVREDEATRAHRMSDAYRSALRDAVEAVRLSPSADIDLIERSQVIAEIQALGGER